MKNRLAKALEWVSAHDNQLTAIVSDNREKDRVRPRLVALNRIDGRKLVKRSAIVERYCP